MQVKNKAIDLVALVVTQNGMAVWMDVYGCVVLAVWMDVYRCVGGMDGCLWVCGRYGWVCMGVWVVWMDVLAV